MSQDLKIISDYQNKLRSIGALKLVNALRCVSQISSIIIKGSFFHEDPFQTDLDIGVYCTLNLSEFLTRENLESTLPISKFLSFFINTPPRYSRYTVIVLLNTYISADIVFFENKSPNLHKLQKLGEKLYYHATTNKNIYFHDQNEIIEIYYRFWIDSFCLIESKIAKGYLWEGVRGVNILREKHLLPLLLLLNKVQKPFYSYKDLYKYELTYKPKNYNVRLNQTLPKNVCKNSIIEATQQLVSLFNEIWNQFGINISDEGVIKIKRRIYKYLGLDHELF